MGRALRAADEVSRPLPLSHPEDDAGCGSAGERGVLAPFIRETFDLYWEEGGAPKGFDEADEDGPLGEVSRRIGRDPEEVLEKASSGEAKETLKSATAGAIERGVFGAPTFFVGDEMF